MMDIFDYLNSRRGSSLLAIYAAILVILAVIALTFVIVIRSKSPDIPVIAGGMLSFILTAAFGTHLAEVKLSQPPPEVSPPQPPAPPAE